MESIGEKLRTAREKGGYNLDQIARDTNIAKHYLTALEEEDFQSFAGETYIVGFLRTYAEYLGLNPEELITLYRNFRIQEQPVPLNELLDKGDRKPIALFIVILVIIIAGLAVGGYFLIPRIGPFVAARKAAKEAAKERGVTGVVYEMKDEMLERRFSLGDEIAVIQNDTRFGIILKDVSDKLTVAAPQGPVTMKLGDEKLLDLDGDKTDDIKLFLRDIDISDGGKAVVLRLDRFTLAAKSPASAGSAEGPEEASELYAAEGPAAVEEAAAAAGGTVPAALGMTTLPSRKVNTLVLLENPAPKPISVDIIFRGYCLLRYVSDGAVREERYFHKGETFRLDASKEVKLWVSNAGSLKAKIAGIDVELGRPGEIATRLIHWRKNEEGGAYSLEIVPIY